MPIDPAFDPLKERLQRAVAPDYRVEPRIGEGGMGVVYRAHQGLLNRGVAIKVLRPELYTAEGAQAFLREAQTLADVKHPNVIVIHDAREGQGLQYYIMELVNGPTLERRLEAGPMPPKEVVRIGIDLLRGLQAMHRVGFVHRDVKPSNVFVLSDGAKLGDFGIARPPSADDGDPHNRDGTTDYMAPEQRQGKSITPRSDIYSVGVVLYEAVSGRPFQQQSKQVDWSGIPYDLAVVLKCATATNPEERWPDAQSFREALEKTQRPHLGRWLAAIGSGGALVGAIAWVVFHPHHPSRPTNPGAPLVAFGAIEYVGPTNHRPIADSLARMVRSDLREHIHFGDSASLSVQARMTVTDSNVGVRLTGGIPAREFHVALERWPALRDSLSYQIVLGVWRDRSPLAASLPPRALPRTSEGLAEFMEAEQLVAETEWEKAHAAYVKAVATDSSCWICLWRMTEVERWLGMEPDPERVHRYLAHADSLPRPYPSLIRAAQLPLNARLDTLHAVTERSREFFLGWFQLGDELFHRGPLAGHHRSEAIPAFERAARLRPDFGPAWEHLVWVATAEGDSASAATAATALDSLQAHSTAPDDFSLVLRALLQLGFAWRFYPPSDAQQVTELIVNSPEARSSPNLGAGPRMLLTFDVPRGAIALGQILQQSSVSEVRRSGLIGQTVGSLAIGRLEDTRTLAAKLTSAWPEADLQLFTAELQGALALVDAGSVPTSDAVEGLRPWSVSEDVKPQLRDRAVWMRALLGHRTPLRDSASPELKSLLIADSLAAASQQRAALRQLDRIDVNVVARRIDPFFRTIVHFQRAAWRAHIGDIEGARSELVWYEHLDLVGIPTGLPQAADVDWAFGTMARWRLARLLDAPGRTDRGEACEAYAAVIRNWSEAPAPYGARADTARTRAGQLHCTLP